MDITQINATVLSLQKAIEDKKASPAVSKMYWRALRANTYHQRFFDRSMENWRMFCGLDAQYGMGQWPAAAVQFMIAKKRPLVTYNLAKVAVDNLLSSLIQVPFDPE